MAEAPGKAGRGTLRIATVVPYGARITANKLGASDSLDTRRWTTAHPDINDINTRLDARIKV